jgi:hypothetical protein
MKAYQLKSSLGSYIGLFASSWDAVDSLLVQGATKLSVRLVK